MLSVSLLFIWTFLFVQCDGRSVLITDAGNGKMAKKLLTSAETEGVDAKATPSSLTPGKSKYLLLSTFGTKFPTNSIGSGRGLGSLTDFTEKNRDTWSKPELSTSSFLDSHGIVEVQTLNSQKETMKSNDFIRSLAQSEATKPNSWHEMFTRLTRLSSMSPRKHLPSLSLNLENSPTIFREKLESVDPNPSHPNRDIFMLTIWREIHRKQSLQHGHHRHHHRHNHHHHHGGPTAGKVKEHGQYSQEKETRTTQTATSGGERYGSTKPTNPSDFKSVQSNFELRLEVEDDNWDSAITAGPSTPTADLLSSEDALKLVMEQMSHDSLLNLLQEIDEIRKVSGASGAPPITQAASGQTEALPGTGDIFSLSVGDVCCGVG